MAAVLDDDEARSTNLSLYAMQEYEKRSRDLFDEVMRMLDYVTATGISIDPALQSDVANLCARKVNTRTTRSRKDTNEPEQIGTNDAASFFELLLRVHVGLAGVISPATPTSLEATERQAGGWLIRNQTINLLIKLTIVSLFLLLTMMPFHAEKQEDTERTLDAAEIHEEDAMSEDPAAAEDATSGESGDTGDTGDTGNTDDPPSEPPEA